MAFAGVPAQATGRVRLDAGTPDGGIEIRLASAPDAPPAVRLRLESAGPPHDPLGIPGGALRRDRDRWTIVHPGAVTETWDFSGKTPVMLLRLDPVPSDRPLGLIVTWSLETDLAPRLDAEGRSLELLGPPDGEPQLRWGPVAAADETGREVDARLLLYPGDGPDRHLLGIEVDPRTATGAILLKAALLAPGDEPQSPRDAIDPSTSPHGTAAAPPNDLCSGAETIPAAGPFPYTTALTADISGAGSAGDPPLPSCQSNAFFSVWYSFTPSVSGAYSISDCADGPTGTTVDDTVVSIYTAPGGNCAGPFTELPTSGTTAGCDDDSCAFEAFQSSITTTLTAGTRYFIVVWKFGSAPPPAGGTAVQVRVTQVPAPPTPPINDLCAGAMIIPSTGPFPHTTPIIPDLTGATTTGDPLAPSCSFGPRSRSVWFRFAPTQTGTYSFSTCADAPTGTTVDDTLMTVYSATSCMGPFVEVSSSGCGDGCDQDACVNENLQASIATELTGGTTYLIVVWQNGTAPPAPGNTALQLRADRISLPPPANDQCAGRTIVPTSGPFPWTSPLVTDITGATCLGDPAAPSCAPATSRGVWYQFTPPTSGPWTLSTCADAPTLTSVDDTVVAVYTSAGGCSGPFVEVPTGCDNDSCNSEALQSTLTMNLNAGTAYYVLASQYGQPLPAAAQTALQLRVSQALAPPNDLCAGAPALTLNVAVDAATNAFTGNNYELAAASVCYQGVGQAASTASGRDLVWKFTAPTADTYSFRATNGQGTNLVLIVDKACESGPSPVVLSQCLAAANRSPATVFSAEETQCLALNAGQTVWVIADETVPGPGSPVTVEVTRCSAEVEPNDSPAQAGVAGTATEGSITPAGEADFFTVGIPAPGSRVFSMADGIASSVPDFDLRLTTAADTLEYDDLNNDTPFGAVSPNLAGTPAGSGESFLRVSLFAGPTTSEPYRLNTVIEPPLAQALPESEPNDLQSQADPVGIGYVTATLASASDRDCYAVIASAGDLIMVSVDGDPLRNSTPIDPILELLDQNGTLLVTANDAGSTSFTQPGTGTLTSMTPSSPGEALLWRARANGAFTARVRLSTGLPGDYALSVSVNGRVLAQANVGVTLTGTPKTAIVGALITWTAVVKNNGPATARNVRLGIQPPAGLLGLAAVPAKGSCVGTPPVCWVGDLTSGQNTTVTITGSPQSPGTIVQTVTVTPYATEADAISANDLATDSTVVVPAGVDSDGDGVPDASDCAPSNPGAYFVPTEVTGVAFGANEVTLSWLSAAMSSGTATVHDVMAGTLGQFPVGGKPGELCLLSGTAGTSASDTRTPAAGAGFYYLVRARNVCGNGGYGKTSAGVPRVTTACP